MTIMKSESKRSALRKISEFKNSRKGNFAIMAAMLSPIIFLSASLAIDVGSLTSLKTRLQAASDSVSLTVATRIKNDDLSVVDAEIFGKALLTAQMYSDQKRFFNMALDPEVVVTETIEESGTIWKVRVGGTATQDTIILGGIVNKERMGVATDSTAISGAHRQQGSVSLGMVVDISGSMGWSLWSNPQQTRLDALKEASGALFTQLKEIDSSNIYVRTGATAYNSRKYSHSNLSWAIDSTQHYINSLQAGGWTNSSEAIRWMYDEIRTPEEAKAHEEKSGQTPTRIILFMTDGSNATRRMDYDTLQTCAQAKNDDVRVITVAFEAPRRGKNLLKECASSPDDYFETETASELISAFKGIGKSTAKSLTRLTN